MVVVVVLSIAGIVGIPPVRAATTTTTTTTYYYYYYYYHSYYRSLSLVRPLSDAPHSLPPSLFLDFCDLSLSLLLFLFSLGPSLVLVLPSRSSSLYIFMKICVYIVAA